MHHQKLKLAAGLQRQISEVEEQQVTPVAPDPRILRCIFSGKRPVSPSSITLFSFSFSGALEV